MASGKILRGEMRERYTPVKPDSTITGAYTGQIDRSYQNKPKWSITPKGKVSFEVHSDKTQKELELKYPGAVVSRVVFSKGNVFIAAKGQEIIEG
jgi:hypothetical protein